MGLGKTAQSVALLEYARLCNGQPGGPFLVVAPLTTLTHWQREVHKWTHMNAVVYDGSAADREACAEADWLADGCRPLRRGGHTKPAPLGTHPYKFDVLLTTYDAMRREQARARAADKGAGGCVLF